MLMQSLTFWELSVFLSSFERFRRLDFASILRKKPIHLTLSMALVAIFEQLNGPKRIAFFYIRAVAVSSLRNIILNKNRTMDNVERKQH
jgi:hypothetical protein